MTAAVCQRWLGGRASYRPASEVIRTADFDVGTIDDDTTARAFVETHHYSVSYPAARERVGLYRRGALAGVAVFSHPSNDRVLTNTFPGTPTARAVELGRFVLLDEVGANGETWFLARCFTELRRAGIGGVVSFSDPVARTSADGAAPRTEVLWVNARAGGRPGPGARGVRRALATLRRVRRQRDDVLRPPVPRRLRPMHALRCVRRARPRRGQRVAGPRGGGRLTDDTLTFMGIGLSQEDGHER